MILPRREPPDSPLHSLQLFVTLAGQIFPDLESEMATHSNILAWKIPQTDEPGGLQPMGS